MVIPAVSCRLVAAADELAEHHHIRHAVFVAEQRMFADSDLDDRDRDGTALHVLGLVGAQPAGTVRLYPLGEGRWQGDRLAVLPEFRTSGLGAPLVRFAVETAGGLGGRRMVAHIQPPNEPFFQHLGWTRRGGVEQYVGHPHLLMEIPLVSG
jgi:putative N-acetyltransferase (TIGR04045 family)